jgi:hypothetical protein
MDKVLESLEGLPEHVHQFYEKNDADGKFHLQDITPLKNALKNAKEERKTALEKAKQVTAWEKLGKTPDEIAAMLTEREEADAKNAKEKGDFDTLLNQHRSRWEKDLNQVKNEVDLWRNQYVSSHINGNLSSALAKGEATPEGIEVLPTILKERIKVEVSEGKVSTRIVNSDGSPMIGNGESGLATFEDLIVDAKKKYPSLFKGTGGSGSGAPANGSGSGSGAPSNLKRSKMTIPEKTKYIGEHGQEAFLKLPY